MVEEDGGDREQCGRITSRNGQKDHIMTIRVAQDRERWRSMTADLLTTDGTWWWQIDCVLYCCVSTMHNRFTSQIHNIYFIIQYVSWALTSSKNFVPMLYTQWYTRYSKTRKYLHLQKAYYYNGDKYLPAQKWMSYNSYFIIPQVTVTMYPVTSIFTFKSIK